MVTNYIIGSTFGLIGNCIPKHELKYIEYRSWCITRHELIYSTKWVSAYHNMSLYVLRHEFHGISWWIQRHQLVYHDMIYHIITWIHLLVFVHHVTPKKEGKHEFLKTPSNYRAWTICWVFWNPARYCMMLFKLCYIFSNTLKESLKQSWILKHFSILLKVFKIIFLIAILSRFPKRL